MTIKVYEFTCSWLEFPVTVFATGIRQADRIYREWISTHHPEQPDDGEAYIYNEAWVAERPRLARAAALKKSGIGYCRAGEHHWTVGKPKDELLGGLVMPEPSVHYYRVDAEDGDDARVFATSYEEATSLYCAWHLHRWNAVPIRFTIRRSSRWELRGLWVTLRDDMEEDLTGVAGLVGEYYRVLPPDHGPRLSRALN